jgi:hypothetical protein
VDRHQSLPEACGEGRLMIEAFLVVASFLVLGLALLLSFFPWDRL